MEFLMGWLGGATESVSGRQVRDVERVLREMGVDVAQARVPADEGVGWVVRRGSAIVFVHLFEEDGRGYLKLLAPIVELPEGDVTALLRRCLELNLAMVSASLTLRDDQLCVVSERSTTDLSHEEIEELVKRLTFYADELDNRLVAEYGGRLWSETHMDRR